MTQHAREAEVLAARLWRQNAAGGKRAAYEALRTAKKLSGSSRATRNSGSWRARARVPAAILKIHQGGRASDKYIEESKGSMHLDSTMLSLNYKDRAAEWDIDQARHPNVKNLFLHFSVSRPAGHNLSKSKWKSLLKCFLRKIGADGANYTSCIHNNTRNQHVHGLLSRALPSGKLLSDSQNFYRWRAALRRAEEQCGLKSIELDRESISKPVKTLSDRHLNATRLARRLRSIPTFIDPAQIEKIIDRSNDIESFINQLAEQEIDIEISRQKNGAARGILFRQAGAKEYLAGTSVSRDLSLNKILRRIEDNRMLHAHQNSSQIRQLRRIIQTPTHPRQRD